MDKQSLIIKINKNLKRRRICHIVALVVFFIQFILDLLLSVSNLISQKVMINWDEINFYNAFQLVLVFVFILISIFDGIDKKKHILLIEENKDFPIHQKALDAVLSSLFFYSPYCVVLFASLLGFSGAYGLAIVPMIIGHIFYIIAYINMQNYNNLFITDKLEEKTKNKEIRTAQKLLAKTGKIFFIKYYNQIKKYNPIDIFDVIQEEYSEEDKKCRIANAKKIFYMNLQLVALNIILKNEDGVANQEIIEITQSILEQEISEQLVLKEKQRKEKEEKNRKKKKEIVPDCSICRYNIDEKHCEVWDKKPVEPCEEFKLKKR